MSDNEDLLADDLGDHSLADYNLGNDEEDQLLADDYESGPQNVPTSIDPNYNDGSDISSSEFSGHGMSYSQQPYQPPVEECVVPNITVEVPNIPDRPIPDRSTYAPYEPPVYEPEHAVVPPAIPAAPIESPQIVPSELSVTVPNGDNRERFLSERPPGAQRLPQQRDIPDSLDKVFVPRGGYSGGRGRTSWRSAQFQARFQQPYNNAYRRHNVHRGNFLQQRPSFPPPPQVRPSPPQIRPEPRPELIRPDIRPDQIRPPVRHEQIRPDIRPDNRPQPRPEMRPEPMPPMGPEISPERPIIQEPFRPMENRPPFQNFQRFPFRPNMEEPRPNFGPMRPNFEPRFFQRPPFNPRPFGPPIREVVPNSQHMPQITIRQPLPGLPLPANVPKFDEFGPKPPIREPEVRMLPVQLPPTLPGALAGKKVLINPHFKGNFQPPVEGPIKDIDDAAERFIAEQRNALARAANRKFPRRSPQRYIENTTIEIENELAPEAGWRGDDDLLRRQEEFINANRQGLRRRMRSPTPPRRSPSPPPRHSPERRRAEPRRPPDEESEYRRRVREQESLRERVLRAKEVRRRKNAVQLHKQLQDKERERNEAKDPKSDPKPESKPAASPEKPSTISPEVDKPDTTRASPERKEKPEVKRDRSPVKEEVAEVNSTCENLTPPRVSPERALTPPLPDKTKERRCSEDDDLAFLLGDIDDMLSDDEDSGRFKEKPKKAEVAPPKPAVDLRSKLPPRPPRQKIVFEEEKPKKRREKSPPAKKPAVTSSTKIDTETPQKKVVKPKPVTEPSTNKSRQRIIFENKEPEKEKEEDKSKSFTRRVVLQRKVTQTKEKSVFSRIEASDPSKPNPGIFSRAVRTAIGSDKPRIVLKRDEPEVEYESGSDDDRLLEEESGLVADVSNLPHGITDTRLKTLAGSEVQSLILDKEDRSAKITFKTTVAASAFRKKFNNKMVAASRLTVTLL
ncbi:RNA-binding protein 33 isoform X2 [Leguminivora glycinivorella]|uniref:RNA-binding protein 33 isoform X2 n=1 Tax=Leguminivora glycinivorella TaxID=1035111 RepID=UPI00200F27FA|nr:RNA-binding protein 33 isoform X2 [Leguminivora glycinivorella]